MKYNVELLKADIQEELEKIGKFELDWRRESLVVVKFQPTVAMVRKQIGAFLKTLEQIETG